MPQPPVLRSRPSRPLLALIAGATLGGCWGSSAVEPVTTPRTWRITGVTVQPLDRRDANGITHFFYTDTLRGQVVFSVKTHAVVVADGEQSPVGGSSAGDPMPGYIANPTEWNKRWLSVDRPVRHRGVEIPANTNLLEVEAIRRSFDGSFLDLSLALLTPDAIHETHFRRNAFDFAPGAYVFTFRWGTATGEVFSDDVPVYIDLAPR